MKSFFVGAWLSRKDMLFSYAALWLLAVTRSRSNPHAFKRIKYNSTFFH
jgi:hypothetical protein